MKKSLWTAVLALAMAGALTVPALGQGGGGGGGGGRGQRGNFDPAQMVQMRLDTIKERIAATDEEWKVLEGKIRAVITEQTKLQAGQGRGGFGGGRGNRGGGGGGGGPVVDQSNPVAVAATALNTSVQDTNTPAEKLKAEMAALRDARKTVQTTLTKAQDDLKSVTTVRQEAVLVSMGILE